MNQSPHGIQSMEVLHQLESLLADDFPSARSQLQRHISNSSSMQRRRASRISKTSSAGSSPQNYQKRRHTTSQTIPRQRRALYQQCLHTPPTSQFIPTSRPISWHPSSIINQHHLPVYSSTAYAHGIPTPMTHTAMNMTPKEWFNPEDPSGFYQQSSDYDLYRNLETENMMQGSYFNTGYQPEASAVFSPVMYPGSAVPGSMSTHNTYTAPATPDFIPSQMNNTPQRPVLPRTASKELVGMGLYDGPDRNSWTLDNYMDGDSTARPLSLGKGLKLEETWEPPEEDDKTDDEDDDAEDDQPEETIQEQLEQVAREAPQLPPVDVTKQSFFFDTTNTLHVQTGIGQHMTMPSYGMVL